MAGKSSRDGLLCGHGRLHLQHKPDRNPTAITRGEPCLVVVLGRVCICYSGNQRKESAITQKAR